MKINIRNMLGNFYGLTHIKCEFTNYTEGGDFYGKYQ